MKRSAMVALAAYALALASLCATASAHSSSDGFLDASSAGRQLLQKSVDDNPKKTDDDKPKCIVSVCVPKKDNSVFPPAHWKCTDNKQGNYDCVLLPPGGGTPTAPTAATPTAPTAATPTAPTVATPTAPTAATPTAPTAATPTAPTAATPTAPTAATPTAPTAATPTAPTAATPTAPTAATPTAPTAATPTAPTVATPTAPTAATPTAPTAATPTAPTAATPTAPTAATPTAPTAATPTAPTVATPTAPTAATPTAPTAATPTAPTAATPTAPTAATPTAPTAATPTAPTAATPTAPTAATPTATGGDTPTAKTPTPAPTPRKPNQCYKTNKEQCCNANPVEAFKYRTKRGGGFKCRSQRGPKKFQCCRPLGKVCFDRSVRKGKGNVRRECCYDQTKQKRNNKKSWDCIPYTVYGLSGQYCFKK